MLGYLKRLIRTGAAYQASADSNTSAFRTPCVGFVDNHPAQMLSLALAADGMTVIAMGTSTPANSGGGDQQPQATYVSGTIISVDTTSDTLVLSSAGVQTPLS